MTVSIANMSQVWMSNTNVYSAIGMSVSTMGYGANVKSAVINLSVDGNSIYRVNTEGVAYSKVNTVSNLVSASLAGVGSRAFVIDASATTFGSVVTGSGPYPVPVYSDGAVWRIG